MGEVRLANASHAFKILNSPAKVVPVDASWFMPDNPRNARDEFLNEDRIKSSVFFDLDAVSSPSKYPHMLPSSLMFCSAVGQLGITPSDTVLVYDRSGIFSAPRAAWTFTLNGHKNVYLLDHYPKFKAQFDVQKGRMNDSEPTAVEYKGIDQDQFFHNYREQVIEYEELHDLVLSNALAQEYYFFDARSSGRFAGQDPEPRSDISSGHIPGSLSMPFSHVLDENGHFKSREELVSLFKLDCGVDLTAFNKKIIVSCGTGITAVILRTAIKSVDKDIPVRVYDGSWTEWAHRAPDLIEKSI